MSALLLDLGHEPLQASRLFHPIAGDKVFRAFEQHGERIHGDKRGDYAQDGSDHFVSPNQNVAQNVIHTREAFGGR